MSVLKPLRELVSFKGGGTPSKQVPEYWDGDIPWASVKDFTSTTLSETQDFITQEGLRNSSANLIPKGHVIIPTRMSLGKAAINTVDLAINQDLRALVPRVPLDAKFLLHAVLSLKDEILKRGSGATVKGITQEELYKLEIPVPEEFDDQIRIAHLLGKVEGLIAQRKQHLQQLDDLLKSVFLDMFGDPVRNEKGWKIGSLSSYGSFKNGLNFGRGESGATVRYLGVGDFKSKAVLDDFNSLGFIELNDLPAADYFLRDGDLLFVRSNGNRELVGRCMAVYPGKERATYSGFCIRYRIADSSLLAIYIAHLFRSAAFRRMLFQGGQGANIQNINQQILSGLPIPIPVEALQNQFVATVEQVETLKSRYQESLTDLEILYGALSQQAFKGELDLSRVALPAAPIEGESSVAAALSAPITTPVIELPETDLLLPALQDRTQLTLLLRFWLEAYCKQLGRAAFSLECFIAAAETRIAELHPDNAFEWAASDYECIKTWVFEALAAGALMQAFDDDGNRIELKALSEQSTA